MGPSLLVQDQDCNLQDQDSGQSLGLEGYSLGGQYMFPPFCWGPIHLFVNNSPWRILVCIVKGGIVTVLLIQNLHG